MIEEWFKTYARLKKNLKHHAIVFVQTKQTVANYIKISTNVDMVATVISRN